MVGALFYIFLLVQVLMKRINLCGKLHGHKGCVNAVEFNSTGDFLVSGSDDKLVIFWDWKDRREKFSYLSGHLDNIFQTRIMPFTDDRKIITSSADGQVSVTSDALTLPNYVFLFFVDMLDIMDLLILCCHFGLWFMISSNVFLTIFGFLSVIYCNS